MGTGFHRRILLLIIVNHSDRLVSHKDGMGLSLPNDYDEREQLAVRIYNKWD